MRIHITKKSFTLISGSIVLLISVLIKLATLFPSWIEKYYSSGLYPYIATANRVLFGWLPFSFGDVLYTLAGVYLVHRTIVLVKLLYQRQLSKAYFKQVLTRSFFICSAIYIIFNLQWGLNYNRPGIAQQLKLSPGFPQEDELKQVTQILVKKVNEKRLLLGQGKIERRPYPVIFRQAHQAFRSATDSFPFLQYRHRSVKKSLYGGVGHYLGFLGYYNPFTGEAQLNLTQPYFLLPLVTCHEMAHQLGYASESQASFAGFLAAVQSPDPLFHYSAYFDMFNYANRELYNRDSAAARQNYNALDTLVKADVAELRKYWDESENPIEPIIKSFYDKYLKANQQDLGVKSYNQVTAWLIAYYKSKGKL